jgi:hypothetical protein
MSSNQTTTETKGNEMNKITISETTVRTMGEYGPSSYQALNLTGKGRVVATIQGDFEPIPSRKEHFGACMIKMADGVVWCVRDVLAMARRGERGLMVV